MIRYALKCDQAHDFEAWFGSSSDFDDQAARGLVECPFCGSHSVQKAIMAPAVSGARKSDPALEVAAKMQSVMMAAAREVRAHVEANFDYVGDAFAREARDIHEGKSEKREIYGQATPTEVRKLKDDGVPCSPLPAAPPVLCEGLSPVPVPGPEPTSEPPPPVATAPPEAEPPVAVAPPGTSTVDAVLAPGATQPETETETKSERRAMGPAWKRQKPMERIPTSSSKAICELLTSILLEYQRIHDDRDSVLGPPAFASATRTTRMR